MSSGRAACGKFFFVVFGMAEMWFCRSGRASSCFLGCLRAYHSVCRVRLHGEKGRSLRGLPVVASSLRVATVFPCRRHALIGQFSISNEGAMDVANEMPPRAHTYFFVEVILASARRSPGFYVNTWAKDVPGWRGCQVRLGLDDTSPAASVSCGGDQQSC